MANELFPDGHFKPYDVGIIVVQSVFISIAAVCVGLRMYARVSLKRRIAVDDVFILFGFLFALARVVVASLSSQVGWASRQGPEAVYQVPYYLRYFERRLLYALSALFIRAGVLTYYLRLFPPALRRLRAGSWILLGLSFAQGLQLTIVLAVDCSDIDDLYRGDFDTYKNPLCSNASEFTYSGAIVDAILDFMIYGLPIPYVWGLRKLPLEQRLGLVCVFGIGIIACIFALMQMPFIVNNYTHGPSGQQWFGWEVSTFIAIELALGLTAASLPDLRGLIARKKPTVLAALRHKSDPKPLSTKQLSIEQSPWYLGFPEATLKRERVGLSDPSESPARPSRFKKLGKFKKPDWLRSDISSLLSTTHGSNTRPALRSQGWREVDTKAQRDYELTHATNLDPEDDEELGIFREKGTS